MQKISFIIPCHNEEEKLQDKFETLRQTALPEGISLREVIFVDDGSCDQTFSKLSNIAQDYPTLPVSVITYKERLGLLKAAKEGIKHSQSKFNLVLNSDLSDIDEKLSKLTRKPKSKRHEPLVSVIMPIHNAEKFLGEAIESILNQTYKRFELILIDNGSIDNSLKIARLYKNRNRSKITIITTQREILEDTANLGIGHAKGKYIAIMEPDSIAAPERLEKQVAFLEHNKRVFLVGSNAFVLNKNGKVADEIICPDSPSEVYHAFAIGSPIINSSVMLRKKFAGKYFSYQVEHDMNNDYSTFFKLASKGYIFANLHEKLISKRIPEVTSEEIKKNFLNTLSIRFNMLIHSKYRFKIKDLFANLAQALYLLILPKRVIKHLPSYSDLLKPRAVPLPV